MICRVTCGIRGSGKWYESGVKYFHADSVEGVAEEFFNWCVSQGYRDAKVSVVELGAGNYAAFADVERAVIQ